MTNSSGATKGARGTEPGNSQRKGKKGAEKQGYYGMAVGGS